MTIFAYFNPCFSQIVNSWNRMTYFLINHINDFQYLDYKSNSQHCLRGRGFPNPNWARFICYFKIINTDLKSGALWSKLSKENKNVIFISVGNTHNCAKYGVPNWWHHKKPFFFFSFQHFEYHRLVDHGEKPPQPKFGGNWFMGARNMVAWIPN